MIRLEVNMCIYLLQLDGNGGLKCISEPKVDCHTDTTLEWSLA